MKGFWKININDIRHNGRKKKRKFIRDISFDAFVRIFNLIGYLRFFRFHKPFDGSSVFQIKAVFWQISEYLLGVSLRCLRLCYCVWDWRKAESDCEKCRWRECWSFIRNVVLVVLIHRLSSSSSYQLVLVGSGLHLPRNRGRNLLWRLPIRGLRLSSTTSSSTTSSTTSFTFILFTFIFVK